MIQSASRTAVFILSVPVPAPAVTTMLVLVLVLVREIYTMGPLRSARSF